MIRLKNEEYFFWFVLIDVLFLPYLRILHMSFSLIPVIIWTIIHIHSVSRFKKICQIFLLATLAFISTVVGLILYGDQAIQGITDLVTFIIMLMYYVYFCLSCSILFETIHRGLHIVLLLLILVSFLFAVLWLIAPAMYFNVRSFWSMNGDTIEFVNPLINRYTYIMSDPNSIGTLLCSVLLLLLLTERDIELWKKMIAIGLTMGTTLISMSTTAVVVFVMSIILYWFVNTNGLKRRINTGEILCLILMIPVACIVIFKVLAYSNMDIFQLAKERIGGNLSEGSLSGRIPIWKSIIESFNWIENTILGKGTIIDRFGIIRRPHNGHFYIILSYGLIAYIVFMSLFFQKPKRAQTRYSIILIPTFLLFTLNTMMQDYRACLLFAFIVAYYQVWATRNSVS